METTGLFNEFEQNPSKDKWLEVLKEELKGADVEKVVWKTYEKLNFQPYYKKSEIANLAHLDNEPGKFPFVRSNKPADKKNNWCVRQSISVTNHIKANELAVDALKKGADSIGFKLAKELRTGNFVANEEHGVAVNTKEQFAELLKNIDCTKTGVHFCAETASAAIADMYLGKGAEVKGSIDNDPIKELLKYGKISGSRFEQFADIFAAAKKSPKFKATVVNSHHFHEAGASMVEELAFTVATAVEYINFLNDTMSVEEICAQMGFSFSVGSAYLMEIAKLRAFRLVWSQVVKSYNADEEAARVSIHAKTSNFNKTIFDPHVNMLRTTTEAMSAVIGGCNSLSVVPFDDTYKEADEFSLRMARNVQLILKEECAFDKITDPAGGSYYLETLTNSIAKEAWTLFQEVQKQGGMLAAVKNGFVQKRIRETASAKEKAVLTLKDTIVGTNQYPNLDEVSVIEPKSKGVDFVKSEGSLTALLSNEECSCCCGCSEGITAEPLRIFRLAEKFEALRLRTEAGVKAGKKRPTAHIATLGDMSKLKLRVSFALNFLGVPGFAVTDNGGFATVEDAVKATVDSKAEIAVICASDEDYATVGIDFAKKLKAAKPDIMLVLAGYPEEQVANLKAAGVDEFIHRKTNLIETCNKIQVKLGM